MKILKIFCLIPLLLAAFAVFADGGWRDKNGNLLPDSPSSKSKDGFAVMLLVTPDADWEEKWNTPPETTPHFSEATKVGPDGELFILTFLANPQLDASGMASVSCDFIVARPDGSKSVNELDMPCFETKLTTDPKNVYLTAASLKYVTEPADPRGEWTVNVTLRDNVRGIEIPLATSFTVY